ncbi:MAG TPA: hypothetical protein VGH98_20410 [Gemmatimonadaceae bacterium]|jgi:hypothetical protein
MVTTFCVTGIACSVSAQATGLIAGASGILLATHATGTPQGRTITEAYLTQPMLSADWRASWFEALGILNLEGLTLRRGELDLGAWGEGYVDRRHPHAYVHELMAGVHSTHGIVAGSLYAGRGFVPFGSDDPMTRPFVSYPVDHHLAQILERLMVVGALRGGPLVLEAATFNGDEPLDSSTLPLARRFGDSWALRGTLAGESASSLLGRLELAASYAGVKSPEFREGQGLDQRKAHVDLRLDGAAGPFTRYALVEAARTTDVDRGRALYSFDAVLAEAAICRNELGVAARWERSDRPEEERLLDLFRSARPATDASILGVTQWTTVSAAIALPAVTIAASQVAPFVEVARITADRTTAAVFDPVSFYGTNLMWRLSLGLRLGLGHMHERVGRYGVAAHPMSAGPHEAHDHGRLRRCFS